MKITQHAAWSCLAALALSGCGSNNPEVSQSERVETFCLEDSFRQKLEFEQPVSKQVTEGIPLTGAVETNPDKVVHFVSLVGGVISNTYFSLGDKVAKGQVLAELRSAELSSLQAEKKNLELQLKVAESRLQSTKSMYEDGVSSQRDLLEAQSELDILKSQLQRVNANLTLYSASPEKGVFQIKAPTSGIITSKSIAAGTQISAEGEPLFTISDLSEVWVMANIHASNVQYVQEGMSVDIKSLSYPDETFKGKVTAVSQVYDNEARVLKARIVLPNTDLRFKPGMLVDVMALKELDMNALSIPTRALVFDNNQDFVIVHRSDCELEIRKVEVLTSSNGTTFLAAGLKEDETLVSKNQLLVYEQLKNLQD